MSVKMMPEEKITGGEEDKMTRPDEERQSHLSQQIERPHVWDAMRGGEMEAASDRRKVTGTSCRFSLL